VSLRGEARGPRCSAGWTAGESGNCARTQKPPPQMPIGYETIRVALTVLPRAPLTVRSFIGDIRGDQAIEDARYSAPVDGRRMVGRDGM
jgi:hypothetical protein